MKTLKTAKELKKDEDRRLRDTVEEIIDGVRDRGDQALYGYTRKFDGFEGEDLRVNSDDIKKAYDEIDEAVLEDLEAAMSNIKAFAEAQRASMQEVKDFNPMPGISLSHRIIPVDSCCCYVPGGRYPLFSTALMLIIPAKVAGVERVVATSPVDGETGEINHMTLVAMDLAGADEIYRAGGAQAIAAFAYGTESIKPVDVIVGPGNRYVAEAKRQCYGQVGIDFIAGPSEVLAIIDETADPQIVAADLLAQCEHDPRAKAFLISTDETTAKKVMEEVESELETLDTAEVAGGSWRDYGEVVVADSIDEAVALCNDYAPEHLELNIDDPDPMIHKLRNYGSLFIGEHTAEAFGDYASGTNHTLPTVRAARYTGGLWVGTFLKICTHQSMSREASAAIAPLVSRMARGEGLTAHATAAERRLFT